MLSIGRMANRQHGYYLDLVREDYYLCGGEPPGLWWGRGALRLGLRDTVERRQLERIFAGYTPAGEPLVQNAGSDDRRPGFDLCFSAPKSVSVYWALADQETRAKIQAAHVKAVKAALAYIQAEGAFVRRGKGGADRVPADLVAALFEHSTSRALDPNLHTHALVMNLGVDAEGDTGTLDARVLYHLKMTAGALYRADISTSLHELQLPTERKSSWFELQFVPPVLTELFSKRRAAIVAALAREGLESASAAAFAALDTREAKEVVPPRAELFQAWQSEAREKHADLVQDVQRFQHRDIIFRGEFKDIMKEAIALVSHTRSHFTEHELTRYVAEASQCRGFTAEKLRSFVKSELEQNPNILKLAEKDGLMRYTTADTVKRESELFHDVAELLGRRRRGIPSHIASDVLKQYASPRSPLIEEAKHHAKQLVNAVRGRETTPVDREFLRETSKLVFANEQARAVRDLTSTNAKGIRLLAGVTGSGKTTVLKAVREVFERGGYTVYGVTSTPRARNDLERRTGIQADSFAAFAFKLNPPAATRLKHHAKQLARAARGWKTWRLKPLRLTKKSVLIIDNAQAFDTKQLATLVQAARQGKGIVILVGDTPARQSIEAGGVFASLCEKLRLSTLTRGRRQRPNPAPHKAPTNVHTGTDATAGEVTKKDRVRLTIADDRAAAIRALITDWSKAESKNLKSAIIICATRAAADELNRHCQAEMRWKRVVGNRSISGNGVHFHVGDRVLLERRDRNLSVHAGDSGTITAVNTLLKRVSVRLDNGRRAVLPLRHYKHTVGKRKGEVAMRLGYAVAVSDDWGTVDRSYVLTESGQDRETLNAQLSRSREQTRVYTNDAEVGALVCSTATSRKKTLAADQPEASHEQERVVVR